MCKKWGELLLKLTWFKGSNRDAKSSEKSERHLDVTPKMGGAGISPLIDLKRSNSVS